MRYRIRIRCARAWSSSSPTDADTRLPLVTGAGASARTAPGCTRSEGKVVRYSSRLHARLREKLFATAPGCTLGFGKSPSPRDARRSSNDYQSFFVAPDPPRVPARVLPRSNATHAETTRTLAPAASQTRARAKGRVFPRYACSLELSVKSRATRAAWECACGAAIQRRRTCSIP